MRTFKRFQENRRKDDDYIRAAIKLAEEAKLRGDFPSGALLLFPNGDYLTESNTTYTEHDLTNHAEMNVMRKASATMNRKLKDAVLYSTIEPCLMCAAAAKENGISEIVFGAYDLKNGFTKQLLLTYKGGVLATECRHQLPEQWLEWTCNSK